VEILAIKGRGEVGCALSIGVWTMMRKAEKLEGVV
jgi:hypothetical protein